VANEIEAQGGGRVLEWCAGAPAGKGMGKGRTNLEIGKGANVYVEVGQSGKVPMQTFEGFGVHLWEGGVAQFRFGGRAKVRLVLPLVILPEDELIPRMKNHVHDVQTPSSLRKSGLRIRRQTIGDVLQTVSGLLAVSDTNKWGMQRIK